MNVHSISKQLMDGIHHCNVYDGFDFSFHKEDVSGGELSPVFEYAIAESRAQFIVEIGSWKGKSAIYMAELMVEREVKDPAVLCIDTWLGSDPVHQWTHVDDPTWGMRDMYLHGYPTLYYQFLANVCYKNMQQIIVPFPNTSNVAAAWLSGFIIKPKVIYVDGCHDEEECYLDMKRFWPLLADGGLMFGDDFRVEWYGVICAVNRFTKELGVPLMRTEDGKWLIWKR